VERKRNWMSLECLPLVNVASLSLHPLSTMCIRSWFYSLSPFSDICAFVVDKFLASLQFLVFTLSGEGKRWRVFFVS